MNSENIQSREIATIKKRQLILNLSDADVERLCEKTAIVGITPEELLENFIGDLVMGTYSNGSDERIFADQWFQRCWFSIFSEKTFLRYLTEDGTLNEVLDCMETVESLEADIRCITNSLESGTVEGINGFVTWSKLRSSNGEPFKSREEWETEERQMLEFCRWETEEAQEIIQREWEYFLEWKQPDKTAKTLEEELQKLKEWQEHRHTIELEHEHREDAEAVREKELQEEEQAVCSIKKVR